MKNIFTLVSLLLAGAVYGQQLISQKTENWINGAWCLYTNIVEYAYNQQEQLALETSQERHPTGVMLNRQKAEYVYRTDGQPDQSTLSGWDNTVQAWITGRSITYTYTGNGDPTGFMITNADGTFYRKEETAYNSGGQLSLRTVSAWDASANVWKPLRQFAYTYNADELLVQQIQSLGNETGWLPVLRWDYTYNNAGKLTLVEEADWNNQQWQVGEQITNTYNVNGLLETATIARWDENTAAFINESQTETTYTSDNLEESVTLSVWDGTTFTGNQRTTILYNADLTVSERIEQYWESTEQEWENVSRVLYSYGTAYLGLDQHETEIGQAYPNPVQEVLHVDLYTDQSTTLTILDMQGRVLWSKAGEAKQQDIPVTQWPAGTYLLKINSGTQQQVRKFNKH